jgi:hypothetical protein
MFNRSPGEWAHCALLTISGAQWSALCALADPSTLVLGARPGIVRLIG